MIKRLIKDFENSMAAAAMAESGDPETAREIMSELGEEKEDLKSIIVRNERVDSIIERHDRTEEAIVFAEAGEQEHARRLIVHGKDEHKKILVVGGEDGFSEKLINYSISMAERMQYDIIAINVVPVGKRLFSFLSDKVKAEFHSSAEKAVVTFRDKAKENKIQFKHSVKFGDPDKAIRESHREHKRISFVLAEPEQVTEDGNTKKTSIPVFCLVPEQ
jgi:hypothetical protein